MGYNSWDVGVKFRSHITLELMFLLSIKHRRIKCELFSCILCKIMTDQTVLKV